MNTRRRRYQRMRRKHRGWKFIPVYGLINDVMGIHFIYVSADADYPPGYSYPGTVRDSMRGDGRLAYMDHRNGGFVLR